jgi:hypothetical protein
MDPFSLLTLGAHFDKKRVHGETATLQPSGRDRGAHATGRLTYWQQQQQQQQLVYMLVHMFLTHSLHGHCC